MSRGRSGPSRVGDSASLARGYAIALAAVVAWSWTGILISYLLRRHAIAPMTLAFWRDLGTSVALGGVLWAVRPRSLAARRGQRRALLLHGLALTGMNVSWTWSVAYNGAAVSTVLVYASPGLTVLAARALLAEPLTAVRLLASIASLVGCALVARALDPAAWQLNAPGIVSGVLSAASFAAFSMTGKAAAGRGIDPWTTTLYAFGLAAAALLPIALVSLPTSGPAASLFSLGARWDGWAILLLLLAPTLGGYGLYTASLAHLPAGTANLMASLEPALTALWAYWLLGESLDAAQLWGGALILTSVLSLRLEERVAPTPAPEPGA